MDCKRASILIMEYLDGTLKETDKLELMEHLEGCYQCKEEFSLLTEVIDEVEHMEEIEPPVEIEMLVMSSIDTGRYRREVKLINRLLMLGVVLLSIFVGYTLFSGILFNAIGHTETLKELGVSLIVKFVYFAVAVLPKILEFATGVITLIYNVPFALIVIFFTMLLTFAGTEFYLLKRYKYDARRN